MQLGLNYILRAQHPGGTWPQQYPLKGGYTDYYTLNDSVTHDCMAVMLQAHKQYGDSKYLNSAIMGGNFLLRAVVSAQQPGWAQQYDLNMQPAQARLSNCRPFARKTPSQALRHY